MDIVAHADERGLWVCERERCVVCDEPTTGPLAFRKLYFRYTAETGWHRREEGFGMRCDACEALHLLQVMGTP